MTRSDVQQRLDTLTERLREQRKELLDGQRAVREMEMICHQLDGAIAALRDLLPLAPPDGDESPA